MGNERKRADLNVEIRRADVGRSCPTADVHDLRLLGRRGRDARRRFRSRLLGLLRNGRRDGDLGLGRRGRRYELRRRRRRGEVKRNPDATRNRLAVTEGRFERPLSRGDDRRFVQIAPPDWITSAFETCPSTSTVTARTTSVCFRSASADGGYTASTC